MNSNIEDLFNPLIRRRKVLIPGKGDVPDYSNGTKVRHCCLKCPLTKILKNFR